MRIPMLIRTGFGLMFLVGIGLAGTIITRQTTASLTDGYFPPVPPSDVQDVALIVLDEGDDASEPAGEEAENQGADGESASPEFASELIQLVAMTDEPGASLDGQNYSDDGRGEPRVSPSDPGGRGVPRPGQ